MRKAIKYSFAAAALIGLYDYAAENTALPEYPQAVDSFVDSTQTRLSGFVRDSSGFVLCALNEGTLDISLDRNGGGQNLFQLTADAPVGSVYLNTGGHPNYNRTPFTLQSGDIIDLGQIDSEGQWRRAFIKSGVNEGTPVWINQADVVDTMLQDAPRGCGNGFRASSPTPAVSP